MKYGIAFALALALVQPAWAISKDNMDLLSKHFHTLGTVRYETYAPLGGPEIGVAEIGDDHSTRLEAIRVDGGQLATLLTESLPGKTSGPSFAFLHTGSHLLTYNANVFTDAAGREHERGDMIVRDLTAEGGPKIVFTLKDVVDANFQVASLKFQDNLVWQPLQHFLNTGERLPVRNCYSRVAWDDRHSDYLLLHSLIALPDAATVPEANLNNRAIMYYNAGLLTTALLKFKQAAQMASDNQSLILHNNELVASEIEDLSKQGNRVPGRPFDPALAAYWQGDFKACLGILDARRNSGFEEFDIALVGLAMAQQLRWPEADKYTAALAERSLAAGGRGVQFYSDYLGELVRIARLQGQSGVLSNYLAMLEKADRHHPAYALGIATMLAANAQQREAERVLEEALRDAQPEQNVSDLRQMLFELYSGSGKSTDVLVSGAGDGPVYNIAAYVNLTDYTDLRPALAKINTDVDIYKIEGTLQDFSVTDSDPRGLRDQ